MQRLSISPLRRLLRQSAAKRGLRPGEVVFTGDPRDNPVRISTFVYDESSLQEAENVGLNEACDLLHTPGVTWLNVDGVHDPSIIESIGETIGLHRLVQEDIAHTTQRAKVEEFDGYIYAVVPMLRFDAEAYETHIEQVSLVLGDTWVVSFLEDPEDVFDPVRLRLRQGAPLRKAQSDRLFAALLDVIVDGYFVTFEAIGDLAAEVEEHAIEHSSADVQVGLNALRRELITLRRVIWPVREVLAQLQRTEHPLIHNDTRPYLRDTYDHVVQALDIVESLRDLMAGVLDLYMTMLSNRMNEVMKVLTVVSTVFIPITFISSVYGMNFAYMPELHWRYGYPMALGAMAFVAVGLLLYFKHKHWT
ncbi:MAG: magnesium/cobalt transporter CorA [Bacteroidetes bacterium]|nr:magnesium/cobalt transporter CorA [Bacteroidota bacterium]